MEGEEWRGGRSTKKLGTGEVAGLVAGHLVEEANGLAGEEEIGPDLTLRLGVIGLTLFLGTSGGGRPAGCQ